MSETTYHDQLLTEYLLGSLPAAEAERYDELSVVDDGFVIALSACEKDLVDAYVQGELGAPALAKFKSHYLASPLRREKVAFAEAFRLLPERGASDLPSKARSDATTKRGWLAGLITFLAPRPALQWGFTFALIVLLGASGLLLFQTLRLRQQMNEATAKRDVLQQHERDLQKQLEAQRTMNSTTEQELARVRAERVLLDEELRRQQKPSSGALASFILTPQLRGAGQLKTITIPAGTEQVALLLQLEPSDYSNYSVALLDQSSREILWHSGRIRARGGADPKSLSVSFRAELLNSRTYLVRVSGISSTGVPEPMSDYAFKVVK